MKTKSCFLGVQVQHGAHEDGGHCIIVDERFEFLIIAEVVEMD